MNDTITIERLNHNGEGIGKIDNKTIFIPKTIPGDKVLVTIVENHKKYMRGQVKKYINRNNQCNNPKCKYYYECGGCHISNLIYEEQLKYKQIRVKDIFKKYLNTDINPDIIKSNKEYKYRNKITLQVKNNNLGLYKIKSNNLIKIDKCILIDSNLNNIIQELKKYNLSKVENIILRESDNEIMIYIKGIINKNINKLPVSTIIINNNIIKGSGYITKQINNLKYIVSPDSFYQINDNITEKLYQHILEYSNLNKNDKVIDLYCGTGTIGIYLSKYCHEVIGIEINKSAIKDANHNLKINNINNVKFIEGDVSKIITNKYKADIIVVDPPRSGLDSKTKQTILEISPSKIIYVSCDTMTLVRDIKDLQLKYKINNIKLFDMFPQTYHCESIAVLEKR